MKNSLSAWAGCVAGALDVNVYISGIQNAGFEQVELVPSYWNQEIIETAVEQLDPGLNQQIAEAKQQGKAVMVINEGDGSKLIEVNPSDGFENFDPQKAIFSAKITAWKPV